MALISGGMVVPGLCGGHVFPDNWAARFHVFRRLTDGLVWNKRKDHTMAWP